MHFQTLNEQVRESKDKDIVIDNCIGQRYIAAGLSGRKIDIYGVPGNALGAYLDGSEITVHGSAQDATGDTMNGGKITIEGNAGDAAGYAMRGGAILVRGSTGYRAGIHMKAYKEQQPLLVIGGKAGSFLGEYQAGGTIIVLGLESTTPKSGMPKTIQGAVTGRYCATGMHGGAIYLRTTEVPFDLPASVLVSTAKGKDIPELKKGIETFCKEFGIPADKLLSSSYCVIKPNTKNPYKQLYTAN